MALSNLSGKFGKESMLSLQRFFGARRASVIYTGSLKLDQALGVGGLPKIKDIHYILGICVQVVKNKLAPSMAKAELSIRFGKGICCESEALDLACEHGVIVKDGSFYYIKGKIMDCREEVLRYLIANDGALDDIIGTLRCHLFERQMG
ncbi:hypothetical protein OROGR_016863 [Orobanche gracilis]